MMASNSSERPWSRECQFFLQGNCRFGVNCWNSHEQLNINSDPVVADDGDMQLNGSSTIHSAHGWSNLNSDSVAAADGYVQLRVPFIIHSSHRWSTTLNRTIPVVAAYGDVQSHAPSTIQCPHERHNINSIPVLATDGDVQSYVPSTIQCSHGRHNLNSIPAVATDGDVQSYVPSAIQSSLGWHGINSIHFAVDGEVQSHVPSTIHDSDDEFDLHSVADFFFERFPVEVDSDVPSTVRCSHSRWRNLNIIPVVAADGDVQSHVPSTLHSSHEQFDLHSVSDFFFERLPVVVGEVDSDVLHVQPCVPSKIHSSHEQSDPNNNIVKENKCALSAPIECGICLEGYDETRRPRTLPCAHNFCGSCLQNCIALSGKRCSVCRKPYIAATVDDIPINTDIEKLIQMFKMLPKITPKKKINKDCSELQDSSKLLLTEAANRRIAEELQEDEELVYALALSKVESEYMKKKVSSLLSAAGAKPIVYLELQADGNTLGRIMIQLTCGPKRREQMLRLCTAQGGATWKGSWFDLACNVGNEGEGIRCNGYLTPNGDRCHSAIVKDLEEDECLKYIKGTVTAISKNDARFMICTRCIPSDYTKRPEIGYVVSGLNLLRQALHQYTTPTKIYDYIYYASRITIAEAGVEIVDK